MARLIAKGDDVLSHDEAIQTVKDKGNGGTVEL